MTRITPCPATTPLPTLASGCRVQQTAAVDLDHDARPDCVVWTRCGPDQAHATPDGSVEYPLDQLTVTARGASLELYSNAEFPETECFADFSVLRVGGEQRLLTRARGYGTGNVWVWALLDLAAGGVRRWQAPPLDSAVAPLLGPSERLGKQFDRAVTVVDGQLELSWLVYGPRDPSCCPTGGVLEVRLRPGPEQLEIARVAREPMPPDAN